ncbi:MAG: hypothetical protein KAS11_01055 [Candidatus Aenigmarchaeota archaeon]|nr:hypothetical protein [Candidatus Aenigmarchaeota archaeon]
MELEYSKPLEINKVIWLDKCLKIGKANAKAMIYGFKKENVLLHQGIYCFNMAKQFQLALMVVNSGRSRYKLSDIGNDLNSDDFTVENKYLISVVKFKGIENKTEFWDEICTNGLFDIWDPSAPFKKYNENKNAQNFCIGLLRIYELDEIISDDLIKVNDRNAILKKTLTVKIKRPIINDAEFNEIKDKLDRTLDKF